LARLLHDRAPGGPPVRLRDLPGFLHLLGLLALLARVERGRFEVMIVDCPPAPETVQLLRLGDALGWTVQPATTAHALARLARPLVSRVANLPDADTALATLDEVRARLVRLRAVLQDGARSSIRLLSTSRRTDAAVLRHAYRVLRLFEYPVDAVITNSLPSVLPATRHPLHDDAAAPRWLTVPAWAEEPNTPDALRALAAALYGDHGPALVLTPSPSVEVLTLDGRVALRVPLPLTEPQHAGATQVGDYVTIRAADAHRTIPLPPLLRDRTCTGARLEGGAMTLLFA
jgi:arsenite-transporting ATPase